MMSFSIVCDFLAVVSFKSLHIHYSFIMVEFIITASITVQSVRDRRELSVITINIIGV